MKLKDFIDLEEAVDMSDVFTSHMKVMKDMSGGMSTANFEKLERMIKRSSNTSVKKKFNEFKKARMKAKVAGAMLTRMIDLHR